MRIPRKSRVSPLDLVGEAALGVRSRKGRALLSALGVAIGVAALVGVVGVSSSSRADLLAELDQLGTNLLTVQPGKSLAGDVVPLSPHAADSIARIPPVESVAPVGSVAQAPVRRSDLVPSYEGGGLAVVACDERLPATLGASVVSGVFLNPATEQYPVAVLGAEAARHLGIDSADGTEQIWIRDRYFTVAGILGPVLLAPEIDRSVLVGWPVAESLLGQPGNPTQIYLRTDPNQVVAVESVLARTVNPEFPGEVAISRPSDALAARAIADQTLTTLLLALGLVSLLVGGIGIANIMFVAVLERRVEIGLRRALGATRFNIGAQFILESVLVCAVGGLLGVTGGAALTVGFASSQRWTPDLPPVVALAGVCVAVAVGVGAGAYPALRAALVSPADALRSV